jgi:hypothetical protein
MGMQVQRPMDVVSSDDHHLGHVDQVSGSEVDLSKLHMRTKDSRHPIPLSWVDWVDDKVHLNLTRDDAEAWRLLAE